MIRVSKHNIGIDANKAKLNKLDLLFIDFKLDVQYYINLIITLNLPLKINLSSKLLPTNILKHSKYKREAYKKASEIIRSQIKKSNKRRYYKYKQIYKYFKENHPNHKFTNKKFSELKLKNIITSKYFTKPLLNNVSINLTNEFYDIKKGVYFDNFISLKLPYFNEKGTRAIKINLPIKNHRHSNKLAKQGYTLKNNIQIKKIKGKYIISYIWEKKEVKIRNTGDLIGIDLGYKKLITCSNNTAVGVNMIQLYNKISYKKQGSKKFKRLLIHRDNEINRHVNNLELSNIKTIVIEDLLNVKYKSKFNKSVNNKLQRWSYRKTIDKIERICEDNGISLLKVSPAYTSQTCSKCGNINKLSRKGEFYRCVSCDYEIDADYNASINILNRGVYSLSDTKQ